MVARDTTLNYMEVQSVLNLVADMARVVVVNGDIVDFGRLGTLSLSFKSKVVPTGTEFNANVHIDRARRKPPPQFDLLPSVPRRSQLRAYASQAHSEG